MKLTQLLSSEVSDEEMILAACIPKNNAFAAPLAPVMEWIAGAAGGILWPAAVMMTIIFTVIAVFLAKSDRAQGFIQAILWIFMVVLGVMILLMVATGVVAFMDGRCSDPFQVSLGLVQLLA